MLTELNEFANTFAESVQKASDQGQDMGRSSVFVDDGDLHNHLSEAWSGSGVTESERVTTFNANSNSNKQIT